MACYSPIHAWRGSPRPDGKANIVFRRADGNGLGSEIDLPCGQCIGCRLERSRQWAVRCVHESKLFDDNCFLTLTYNEANLPYDGSLDVRHFQLFMKRLRKEFVGLKSVVMPDGAIARPIRFFHCGEYGELMGRPHYHALLFNFDFVDKVEYSSDDFNVLYRSDVLDRLWSMGNCYIGAVTFESAAYVARYVTKKITGDMAVDHYVNKVSGCVLRPEYITMSRRPGIGRLWFDEFGSDVFPSDEVVVRGASCKPPRFYDKLLAVVDPLMSESVLLARRRAGMKAGANGESDGIRLRVKEAVKRAEIRSISRKLESGFYD